MDEYGEGIPTAWVITNKEDTRVHLEFFKAVKNKVGEIRPKWFMTDDAPQYYNTWGFVFGGEGTNKLLCVWHVDRAWRNALKDHVKTQLLVYHNLHVLLMENEEANLRVLLQQFLSFLDKDQPEFLAYFKLTYCTCLEQWASCFRIGTTVNTNMFVESFHRLLNVVYLQQKQNRRIDYLLHTLLRIARDKCFEQLIKVEKGKNSHCIN